jgi:hypothetical protein
MMDFGLDFAQLCAVVAPDRIPLCGNEHRITRVAFDMFRLDNDKENLWQVQADDDGNEFLVRTYELPKDDTLQAKSEWTVTEDGKKASLTVAYHGMPIHRIVVAEYGVHTPDDVRLLRDLVQDKLADPNFADSMLATLPESKRAALFVVFPKIAVNSIPKIPMPSGKDPLEGIELSDPKKEYGIGSKQKSQLPSQGDWAKKPRILPMAANDDDIWLEQAFKSDVGNPRYMAEAKTIVPKVFAYLKAHPSKQVSLSTLYTELEVNDIPLYIALHALVKGGYINGISPYDEPSEQMSVLTGQPSKSHKDFFYSINESKKSNK